MQPGPAREVKMMEEIRSSVLPPGPRERPDVFAGSFPEQVAYAKDPARLKVAFCTRRASKSFSFGLECVHDSYDWPKAKYLFLGLTRPEAKRIFWADVLKELDEKHRLGMRFNESELVATMPNGATIFVGAADANESEMRKLLGQKYRKVGIDEAQDWQRDLESLVFHVLKAATTDHAGSITLMGTPGLINRGIWDTVTPKSVEAGKRGERPEGARGWSIHCWDTYANTAPLRTGERVCDRWASDIAELREMKPGVDETPWFRRNYKGEKVVEDEFLVYRYSAGRNSFRDLPVLKGGEWRYVLGCDLGHSDATAWVVCAWHEHQKTLYVLYALKEPGLDVTAVAEQTRALMRRWDFDVLVVDGANKQAVEEMRNRHQLPWEAADKTGKDSFIDLMNADFLTGSIRLGPEAEPLAKEYADLVWDKKKMEKGKREEHAACDNHAADAALYAWRYCYSYLSEKPAEGAEKKLREYQEPDEHEARLSEQILEDRRREAGEMASGAWDETWRWR